MQTERFVMPSINRLGSKRAEQKIQFFSRVVVKIRVIFKAGKDK